MSVLLIPMRLLQVYLAENGYLAIYAKQRSPGWEVASRHTLINPIEICDIADTRDSVPVYRGNRGLTMVSIYGGKYGHSTNDASPWISENS